MSDAAGRTVVTGDGRRVTLGKLVKSGGAGSVHRLRDDAHTVAKLYHPTVELKTYERKVAAMLDLRPQLPELQDGDQHIVQLAWPQAAIFDTQRRFLGYLMPAVDIDATSELECVLQERQARALQLPTGLGAKVTLAANLCTVIGELHRQRHYIVDLKPVNLRFYRRSLYLALLDCDGFSIQGRGERFEAPQFTPDYLAPEFHAPGLTVAGEAQQDRFALAVVVFQLLNFGIHPFTGRPQHGQVPTDVPSRIAGRFYSHGIRGNTALLPMPSSGHAAMPAELRTLFDRAFDSHGGNTRPSADEWSDLLRGYAQRSAGKLVVCATDAGHQHFTGHACAACARGQRIAQATAAAASAPPRRTTLPTPPPRQAPRAQRLAQARTPAQVPPPSKWAPQTQPQPPRRRKPPTQTPPPWPAAKPSTNTAHATLARAKPVDWGSLAASFVGFVFLALIVVAALQTMQDPRRPSPTPAAAPFPTSTPRPVVVDAPPVEDDVADAAISTDVADPLASSWPLDRELRQLKQTVDAIAKGIADNEHLTLERRLPALRSAAAQRRSVPYAQAGEGPVPVPLGVEGALYVQARNLHERPVDANGAFAVGWALLARGDLAWAERYFLQAIWADPDLADAWYGYGLVQSDGPLSVGATTVALLMYPDYEQAEARLDIALRDAWPRLPVTREELAADFAKANQSTNLLRSQLSRGTIQPRFSIAATDTPAGAGPQPGVPYPGDDELLALESGLVAIGKAMDRADAPRVEAGMISLHADRNARRAAWDKPIADPVVAPVPGGLLGVEAEVRRLAARPFDAATAQRVGWALMSQHRYRDARRFMLQAIWADPANAEGWYGYGLLRRDTREGRGAIAMGLLLDAPSRVPVRNDAAHDALLPPSRIGAQDLDNQLELAEGIARTMRGRVSALALKGPSP